MPYAQNLKKISLVSFSSKCVLRFHYQGFALNVSCLLPVVGKGLSEKYQSVGTARSLEV